MYGFHARLDPQTMVDLIDKPAVREVADDAKKRLLRVRESLMH